MSTTRAVLRRTLGLRCGEPFFRRFGVGAAAPSGAGTATTLVDTAKLKEEDDYWNSHHLYLPGSNESREISDFDQGTSTLTWLAAVASAPDASDTYELWSQFTALEVNEAINYALASAWPFFFLTARDETTCIEDGDGLYYTIPTTNTVRRLAQVYLKRYNSVTGQVTTTGSDGTQLIDATRAQFTSSDVGKYVAIYKDGGDANGEVKQVTAYVSASELTTAAFSAAPAEDCKYRLLDTSDVYPTQHLIQNWIPNRADFPTEIWLGEHPAGWEGFPICYLYEYEHPLLTTEAGATTCPLEFLYNAALAHLYFIKLSTTPATQAPTWEAMHKAASGAAQLYARASKQRHMPSTILRMDLGMGGFPADYPFR